MVEPFLYLLESLVDLVEPFIYLLESPLDLIESLVDLLESPESFGFEVVNFLVEQSYPIVNRFDSIGCFSETRVGDPSFVVEFVSKIGDGSEPVVRASLGDGAFCHDH